VRFESRHWQVLSESRAIELRRCPMQPRVFKSYAREF
jgi:hypothetical protein